MKNQKKYVLDRKELMKQLIETDRNSSEKVCSENIMLSIFSLHKAFSEARNQNNHCLKEKIMLLLAYCYEENQSLEEADYWYNMCLHESNYHDDVLYKIHILGSLIMNAINSDSFSKADKYAEELQEISSKGDETANEQILAIRHYIEARKIIYYKNWGGEEVKRVLKQSLDLCRRHDGLFLFKKLYIAINEVIGDIYYRIEDETNALKYYQEALKYTTKYLDKRKRAEYHERIAHTYEQSGKMKEALEEYKKYYKLTEEICEEESTCFSHYLLEAFNLNKTESTIKHLKNKKNYLNNKRNIDSLTGVFNRRFWTENIKDILESLITEKRMISILMVDIDFFKNYNDTYGHTKGDEILKVIATTLKESVRKDTDIVARYGGEEFIILLDGLGVQESKEVAGRVLNNVRDLEIAHAAGGSNKTLTLSIGIATGNVISEICSSQLIREADKALYYSKHNGKDMYMHIIDMQ